MTKHVAIPAKHQDLTLAHSRGGMSVWMRGSGNTTWHDIRDKCFFGFDLSDCQNLKHRCGVNLADNRRAAKKLP
jgi:hypothetical protein